MGRDSLDVTPQAQDRSKCLQTSQEADPPSSPHPRRCYAPSKCTTSNTTVPYSKY